MPVFINSGNTNALHQMSYGGVSQATTNFLQGQLAAMKTMPHLQGFYETAVLQYENLNGEQAQRVAEAVLRGATSLFNDNIVRPLVEMEQFQLASLTMQRWLMTSNFLRQQASAGRIHGWKDTFEDQYPGLNGRDNPDWRLLNQGIINEVPDGDWEMVQYFEEYGVNEKPLTLSERLDVFSSINYAEAFVRALEEDPTSPYGDLL